MPLAANTVPHEPGSRPVRSLADTTVVITGAGSGIGRELALQLATVHCRLALVDVDVRNLQETAALARDRGARSAVCLDIDVADRNAVHAAADTVGQAFGSVDLLFNNAGVALIDSVASVSVADFEWLMNINFWGVVSFTKAFLPGMLEAGSGRIVNVSSLFGLCGSPLQARYCASKFAVRGFSEALEMELDGTGVAVSCVHPGGIKTGIARNSRIGSFKAGVSRDKLATDFDKVAKTAAPDAARSILRGVARKRRRILVGRDARIADWMARLLPSCYERLLGIPRGLKK